MAWQDRSYNRERPGSGGNPLMWILTGSVPLFTLFGIRVRAHASFIILIGLVLLFGFGGASFQVRVQSMSILFGVVLLHEFGHCFAARRMGGTADEILMTPLGGLAMAMAPRRPWPTFVTVAGGPLVNVVICILCAIGIYALSGNVLITPGSFVQNFRPDAGWLSASSYLFWIYSISYFLLLFNLLPVYPLDGGQLMQSILWKPMGYFKSMMLSLNIGIVGAVLMIMVGLASFGTVGGGVLLLMIGISCLMNCIQMRTMMRAQGPYGWEEDQADYSASLWDTGPSKPSRSATRAAHRAAKLASEERAERVKIDQILAKVSARGMHSLTWLEKRTLKQATEHQRKRDTEMAASRRPRGF